MALCDLETICAKVSKLVGKEKMGLGVKIKPLCLMWHPQDTPHAHITLLCTTVAAVHSNKQLPSLITNLEKPPFYNTNIRLRSPIVPSNHLTSPLCLYLHTHHNNPLIASPVCKQ